MPHSQFRFKKFTIEQNRCAMKVGTDGVLLGAWADISTCKRILDIGCGSGIISIMAAQRSNAQIIGVEIDAAAASQAAENAGRSEWKERIEIICNDILEYTPEEPFDAIISNPPFFSNALKSSDCERNLARHDDTLTCSALLARASQLLTSEGTLSVVVPHEAAAKWCDEALFKGLSARRITHVRTLPHKPIKRTLIEFTKKACPVATTEEFLLEETAGIYSEQARKLLRDFYLKIE